MSEQMPDEGLLWTLGQKSVLIVWVSTEEGRGAGGNFDRVPEIQVGPAAIKMGRGQEWGQGLMVDEASLSPWGQLHLPRRQ